MFVCVCNGVTDREIRSAVSLGARSLADLTATLGVAGDCGRCADCARGLLVECCKPVAEVTGGDD
jgi:bacterioferritin-associated ferredoxin